VYIGPCCWTVVVSATNSISGLRLARIIDLQAGRRSASHACGLTSKWLTSDAAALEYESNTELTTPAACFVVSMPFEQFCPELTENATTDNGVADRKDEQKDGGAKCRHDMRSTPPPLLAKTCNCKLQPTLSPMLPQTRS